MSGRKVGKRKRRASSRWSPPSLGKKDAGCQVNFFGEEPCLKITVATKTEERTVEVEMVTPLSTEKTAASELQNSNVPCEKVPTDEPNETEGYEETIESLRYLDG